jgi:hypothetical protein
MLLNLDPLPTQESSSEPTSPSTKIPSTKAIDPRKLPQSHLHRPPEAWGWQELRDYVIYHISMVTGEFSGHPTSAAAEAQIFKSFLARYGDNAQMIARYAIDTCDGLWYGSSVDIFYFCKKSDPNFGDPILQLLEAAA